MTKPQPAPAPLPAHPRTLIRRAVCALLQVPDTGLCPVFANREEPWESNELPVASVYTTDESRLETDMSPPPDERELTLVVEVLAKANSKLDDVLDALGYRIEQLVTFAVLEAASPVPVLDLVHNDTSLGMAENGNKIVGVSTLTFSVSYRMPQTVEELSLFITAATDWDLGNVGVLPGPWPDTQTEAQDIVILPQNDQ